MVTKQQLTDTMEALLTDSGWPDFAKDWSQEQVDEFTRETLRLALMAVEENTQDLVTRTRKAEQALVDFCERKECEYNGSEPFLQAKIALLEQELNEFRALEKCMDKAISRVPDKYMHTSAYVTVRRVCEAIDPDADELAQARKSGEVEGWVRGRQEAADHAEELETAQRKLGALTAALETWCCTYGAALTPTGADTFGEGMRAAKDQIRKLIANTLAGRWICHCGNYMGEGGDICRHGGCRATGEREFSYPTVTADGEK